MAQSSMVIIVVVSLADWGRMGSVGGVGWVDGISWGGRGQLGVTD